MNAKTLKTITFKLEGASKQMERAQTKFTEAFADNPAYATEWHLSDVLEAQAGMCLEAEILVDGEADAEGVEQFIQSFEREVAHVRGESKSTSGLTNIANDIRFSVRARLYATIMECERYAAAE